MYRPPIFLLSAVLFSCVACSRSEDTGTQVDPAHPGKPQIEESNPMTEQDNSSANGEVPEAMINKVKADLQSRLGHGNIEVHQAKATTWPDGSMGCGEPGMMYTQMLVEGYRVILMADGKQWDYRLSSTGGFKLCE